MRGGPARRLTGNALGGMLRDLDRRTRTTTRRSRPAGGGEPVEGRQAPPPPPLPVWAPGPVTAVVETGEDGRARWTYPSPFTAPPVLTAVAVDPDPESDDRAVSVVLEEVTAAYAVARVWQHRAGRETAPAAGGVHVHLTAYAGGR